MTEGAPNTRVHTHTKKAVQLPIISYCKTKRQQTLHVPTLKCLGLVVCGCPVSVTHCNICGERVGPMTWPTGFGERLVPFKWSLHLQRLDPQLCRSLTLTGANLVQWREVGGGSEKLAGVVEVQVGVVRIRRGWSLRRSGCSQCLWVWGWCRVGVPLVVVQVVVSRALKIQVKTPSELLLEMNVINTNNMLGSAALPPPGFLRNAIGYFASGENPLGNDKHKQNIPKKKQSEFPVNLECCALYCSRVVEQQIL